MTAAESNFRFRCYRTPDLPSYILPLPSAVWRALWSGLAVSPSSPLGYYLPLWGTLKNAFLGLLVGSSLGLVLGSFMAESRTVEKLLMSYAFALQSLPKVAIAPLIVIWFGFGDGSKVAISALLAFFPVPDQQLHRAARGGAGAAGPNALVVGLAVALPRLKCSPELTCCLT